MINKVTLIGNLGRDPEIRHFEGGGKVSKFSIATNESYKDKAGEWQQQTEWHEIVCWSYLAERVERSLKKGNLVYIEGKLTTRKWQDKNGIDRYTTEVVAKQVKSLERRESGASGIPDTGFPSIEDRFETAKPQETQTSQPSQTTQTAQPPQVENNEKSSIEDDLPF